jgi:predicted DNA-binding transcriptional regulator YafY
MKTDYIKYSERLNYLVELITKNNISSPRQICERFDCCDKTARNMINTLRHIGYDIKYCRYNKRYFVNTFNGNNLTV